MPPPLVPPAPGLPKTLTGIRGFDTVTRGGLPRGRATLVSGGAGCGKTLFGMEFLVRGARERGEAGVFVSFQESPAELAQNVADFGWDVPALVNAGLLAFEHVTLGPDASESGTFDLAALFARIGAAIASVKARRITIDTVEALYAALPNPRVLRAEIVRLFAWLKEQEITAVLTAERVDGALSRTGIEEFVSACVLALDHRVSQQITTRTLRVLKYRGSAHGTNEYPFVIDEDGIRVLPITAIRLEYGAPKERIPTGIAKLDALVGGGYLRGSTVLVTGGAGTGKTTVGISFAAAACARGERAVVLAFEESPGQIVRNMGSVGLQLDRWLDEGLLRIHAVRPSSIGLESHLAETQKIVEQFDPAVVVLDPVTSFGIIADRWEVRSMLMRLVDLLKSRNVTALMTSLTGSGVVDESEVAISSLIDVWIVVRNLEIAAERTRLLYVLKARGSAHSNQVREFILSSDGVDLVDVDVGPEGVLVGSARTSHREAARVRTRLSEDEWARRRRDLDRERRVMEARVLALEAEFASREEGVQRDEALERAHGAADVVGRVLEQEARGRGQGRETP